MGKEGPKNVQECPWNKEYTLYIVLIQRTLDTSLWQFQTSQNIPIFPMSHPFHFPTLELSETGDIKIIERKEMGEKDNNDHFPRENTKFNSRWNCWILQGTEHLNAEVKLLCSLEKITDSRHWRWTAHISSVLTISMNIDQMVSKHLPKSSFWCP